MNQMDSVVERPVFSIYFFAHWRNILWTLEGSWLVSHSPSNNGKSVISCASWKLVAHYRVFCKSSYT